MILDGTGRVYGGGNDNVSLSFYKLLKFGRPDRMLKRGFDHLFGRFTRFVGPSKSVTPRNFGHQARQVFSFCHRATEFSCVCLQLLYQTIKLMSVAHVMSRSLRSPSVNPVPAYPRQ